MARQIEMEISIDTTKANLKLDRLQEELRTLKKEARSIDEDEDTFDGWAKAINQTENEIDKLKSTMRSNNAEVNNSTKSFNTLGDKVQNAFENAGKKARKFTLALFSVRSVFSIISKASQNYLSQNQSTTDKVSAAWTYLGNLIGPVIEKIVGWLQYGIAYLNVFIKALTGVDFLAKSIQKTVAKTNKELKKTVSSMDEIVNLDLDSGAGGVDAGGINALQDIADLKLNEDVVNFLTKLGEGFRTVWDYAVLAWNFLEEHFGTTGAMAIVGGLALILGGASSGGLWGIVAALGAISAVEFGVLISQIETLQRELEKEHDAEAKAIMAKVALYNYYKQQYEAAANEADRAYYLERMESAYNAMAEDLKGYNGDLDKTVQLSDSWEGYYSKTKTLADNIADATKDANTTLKKMDGTTANVKLKIGADLTEAERSSTNWLTRLSSNLNTWLSKFNKGVTNLMHGKSWNAYATGGFPEEGQMFIANERGPELVGTIGGSTAVVNNAQIVESVSQGVAQAVASTLGSSKTSSQTATYLYINGSEFAKAVYDDMNTESRRRNTNTSIRRA